MNIPSHTWSIGLFQNGNRVLIGVISWLEYDELYGAASALYDATSDVAHT